MGQWISSKEFAKIIGISDRTVRARAMQKICILIQNIIRIHTPKV